MLHSWKQRFVASLVSISIIGGALSPTTVLATQTKSVDLVGDYKYKEGVVTQLYSSSYYAQNPAVPPSVQPGGNPTNQCVSPVGKVSRTSIGGADDIPAYLPGNNETIPNNPNGQPYAADSFMQMASSDDEQASNANNLPGLIDNGSAKELKNPGDMLTIDDNSNFTKYVLQHVMDDITEVKEDNIDQKLAEVNAEQGASTADLTNLNQRMASFLYHYFSYDSGNACSFYTDTGDVKWNSINDINSPEYADFLTTTLNNTTTDSLGNLLHKTGAVTINIGSTYDTYGKIRSDNYEYSINNLGVLAMNSGSTGNAMVYLNPDNPVLLANHAAMYECLSEFANFYLDNMVTIANTTNWEQDPNSKASLFYIKHFHDAFAGLIPAVEKIYHKKNDNANQMSLYDMVKKIESDIDALTFTDAITMLTDRYTKHNDNTSPITAFYTINSKRGVASYDRDAVLADMDVDVSKDIQQYEDNAKQNSDEAVSGINNFTVDNSFLRTQADTANEILMKICEWYNSAELITDAKDEKGKTITDDKGNAVKIPNYEALEKLVGKDAEQIAVDKEGKEVREGEDGTLVYKYNNELDKINKKSPKKKDALIKSLSEVIYGSDNILTKDGTNKTKKDEKDKVEGGITKVIQNTMVDWWEETNGRELPLNLNKYDDFYTFWTSKEVVNKLKDLAQNSTEEDVKWLNSLKDNLRDDLTNASSNVVDYGVDDTGKSTSYTTVTINDFIIQGMGFSSTYIPMQTNLYSAETIKSFQGDDEDNTFYNTYLMYGFMRKALKIDTSSSSVQNFYNANGTMTGTTRTATLRDLIECGDSEVALYVDSSFYNADEAEEKANKWQEEQRGKNDSMVSDMTVYGTIWSGSSYYKMWGDKAIALANENPSPMNQLIAENTDDEEVLSVHYSTLDFDAYQKSVQDYSKKTYNLDVSQYKKPKDLNERLSLYKRSSELSKNAKFSDSVLKTNGYTQYDTDSRTLLSEAEDSEYVNLGHDDGSLKSLFKDFHVNADDKTYMNDDNTDTIVLTSYLINKYICGDTVYEDKEKDEEANTETVNTYTMYSGYTPMLSLAFVSCLYRSTKYFSLANVVEENNPVFLASNNLCGIDDANQWYRNTLLNYMLLKNLPGNAQLDVKYVTDLDSPLYIDIFGNILTESGTVVIPAACNATLHTGSYSKYNYAAGLYTCYGSKYFVPTDLPGASSVLYPFFLADNDAEKYVINGYEVSADGTAIRFDKLDTYDDETREALKKGYLSFISGGKTSRLNWMAMVKIVNEVMRGAPIENIDREKENLITRNFTGGSSGLVAAAKLESMIDSFKGNTMNSLLCIPDFSRMDNMEYLVALFLKLLMVATAAVVIIAIYRDGVAGTLGVRTLVTSLSAIALTVIAVVGIPAIFQLTYYSANKLLLQNETQRILLANEEKRQGGAEVGITKVGTVESTGEFAIQLDWIKVPWYDELENILYSSTLSNLQSAKLKAYQSSPVFNNSDVTVHNDGVYVTTDDLFDSVVIDYNFTASGDNRGLTLITTGAEQTASFYSPYYVFLQALTADINEYNRWAGTSAKNFVTKEDAQAYADDNQTKALNSYNFTTKYMSGNRLKTVGVCKAYFESQQFMEDDEDLLHMNQIYMANETLPVKKSTDDETAQQTGAVSDDALVIDGEETTKSNIITRMADNPMQLRLRDIENSKNRSLIFNDEDRLAFSQSYWYNYNIIDSSLSEMALIDGFGGKISQYVEDRDKNILKFNKKNKDIKEIPSSEELNDVWNKFIKNDVYKIKDDDTDALDAELRKSKYLGKRITNYEKRVEAMNAYARDFVASNKDMLGKVTDETFLKVMALSLAIKYNQLFGVPCADAVEIYNMDSEDLVRLCIAKPEEAVMASTMSFPRFVYTFGGEVGVYMAAVLYIILWLGSFIKPLCTVIVFISVFVSIFIFRVVLRKPSANLWGYFITVCLLCATNILHALLLKAGIFLPGMGLPAVACLVFMIFGQVVYLILLAYVTGVSLKDWANLGANEYAKESKLLQRKLHKDSQGAMLSGKVKHHDDNWDYYNDLVDQHRERNAH